MKGFFETKEVQSEARPDGKTYSCASCGLIKQARTPRMKPVGNFKKGILNIGSFPSDTCDQKGTPFSDKAGRFLQKEYEQVGIDLFEDCLNIYAVNCYAEKTPDYYQICCCRKSILQIIKEKKPRIIVLFGEMAVQSIIGHRFKKDLGGIDKWRGWQIPDQDFKAWICPVMEPEKVMEASQEYQTIFRIDLLGIEKVKGIPFREYLSPQIEIIKDLSALKTIEYGLTAFDYETTGLKPHATGHRIVSCSIADSPNHVFAFILPQTKEERIPLLDYLANRKIKKIAQNLKFEEAWSVVRLKQPVKGWVWDTMLASHIFDNRPGVTGLKFQSYVQLGIIDYSSEIEPYLRSNDEKNGNGINRVMELVSTEQGKKSLLTYNALDSINEYRLALLQMNRVDLEILPF